MKRYILLTFMLIFIPATTLCAETPDLYRVELIVFKHITPQSYSNERWPDDPGFPDLQKSLTLNLKSQSQPDATYYLLPKSQWTLNREQRNLQRQGGYQILVHLAWIQPLTSPHSAQSIHIYGGDNYNQNVDLFPSELQTSNEQSIQDWELNGVVTVSKTNYVRVNSDLILTEPVTSLPIDQNLVLNQDDLKSFRLKESQKMKLKEIHYFDHPLFGAIIEVSPVMGST